MIFNAISLHNDPFKYLTYLSTQRKEHYGQLYQMQQTGPEEQVMLNYIDQLTAQCHVSVSIRLLQCLDYLYMETFVIRLDYYRTNICLQGKQDPFL